MEKEDKNLGEVIVEEIKTISNQQIEIAKSEIYEKQDVIFQQAIIATEKKAEEIARTTIKHEVTSLKQDMFVTFGLFTSFIAFIIGEINILKTIDSIYDKIGFSFLFVSFILGFLFGIMFLLDLEIINEKYIKMGWVFSLFFFIGLAFIIIPSLIPLIKLT
jgi:hypothetical protein